MCKRAQFSLLSPKVESRVSKSEPRLCKVEPRVCKVKVKNTPKSASYIDAKGVSKLSEGSVRAKNFHHPRKNGISVHGPKVGE